MATSPTGLGSPPITTPAQISLPVLQQLANNIRERMQRIEAALPAGGAQASGARSAQGDAASASLQRQVASLRADVDRLLTTTPPSSGGGSSYFPGGW